MLFPFVLLSLVFATSMPLATEIEEVHVVFSNHLDVGFTGFSIERAEELKSFQGRDYIYTTHCWLVSLYLDCPRGEEFPQPLSCPNKTLVGRFIDAIEAGIITWHAFPFNVQMGLMDQDMIKAGVSMCHALDDRFGLPRKRTLNQRDVPGLTITSLPTLIASGVEAISVGVNGASAPPDVPTIFTWQPPGSDESLIGMWHPGEYGGVNVSDAVMAPGCKHALIMAWRSDNAGPGDYAEILITLFHLEKQFPNAKVHASTFDNFLKEVLPFKNQLPVIRSEIGDTWIAGVQSDPLKVQILRLLLRFKKKIRQPYPGFQFDRLLLKGFEHTWGLDIKRYALFFNSSWTNEDFKQVRIFFSVLENSWSEQREFLFRAIKLLPPNLQDQLAIEMLKLRPPRDHPPTFGFQRSPTIYSNFTCGDYRLSFHPNSGIRFLQNFRTGQVYANQYKLIGQYMYSTYNQTDYETFFKTYGYCYGQPSCWYLPLDFGKPNFQTAHPLHRNWFGETKSLWSSESEGSCTYLSELLMPEEATQRFGSPKYIWVSTKLHKLEKKLSFVFYMYQKTETRLAEAQWVLFNPAITPKDIKILTHGTAFNPLDVVVNGSRNFHLQQDGISILDTNDKVYRIKSDDVALFAMGEPNPFPTPNIPSPSGGFYGNIQNNIWGTNFVMWYPYRKGDENLKSEFEFEFS